MSERSPPGASSPSSRTVLVTGGAGFIGSHLVDALVARGDSVVVVDDLSSGARTNLSRSEGRFTFLQADITSAPELADRIGAVDVVFHLAALISSHDSLHEPRRYVDANVGGLLRVLDVVRVTGARRLVLASSSTVYGTAARPLSSEDDVPAPMNVYAASKLMGEHLCAMYGARDGFSACALRLFNVYGPRQSASHAYANVVCRFVHAAARGEGIPLYGDGQQARDFVYVDDVVAALLRAGDATFTGVVNVGTGRAHSILDLIARIERIAGVSLARTQHPPWPNDIPSVCADTRRMKELLGVEARVALDEGIARTLAAVRGAAR